jgi:hypothetical protein
MDLTLSRQGTNQATIALEKIPQLIFTQKDISDFSVICFTLNVRTTALYIHGQITPLILKNFLC